MGDVSRFLDTFAKFSTAIAHAYRYAKPNETLFSSLLRSSSKDDEKVCSRRLETVQYQRHGATGHEQAQRPSDGFQK